MNDVPTMLHLIFKGINLATMICVSNLKEEIQKSTLAKFVNNLEDILDDMSSNYSIIVYNVERHEDYVRKIFRDILSGPNSTFNSFIESNKDDWFTGTEILKGYLIQNATEKYNNMVA